MIVSHSARSLFVQVQKTGGQTVQSVLLSALPDAQTLRGLPDGKHARLGAALRAHPELSDYWTFGFVRNPWARLFSWHAMILRRARAAEAGNLEVARRIHNNQFWLRVLELTPDFESFVLRGPDEFLRLRTPQLSYLASGDRRADFIGRTECLVVDLNVALRHLDRPTIQDLPRRNAGPGCDYRSAYTSSMRARVAEVYAADIDAFGYRFSGTL